MRQGEADETHDIDEYPPLAQRISSIPEAVNAAIDLGLEGDFVFNFARGIKAFELTTGVQLDLGELRAAFAMLWVSVESHLPGDADFDEHLFQFEDAYEKVKSPLGSNHLLEAIKRTDSSPMPPECDQVSSPKIRRLIAVCFHLQQLVGEGAFFLAARSAATAMGIKDPTKALTCLNGLVRRRILKLVEKGVPGGKRASRFTFVHQSPSSAEPPRNS